jgi:catechol 2,3-dioxygenase-like lactoylglutathione lyase family enzyme
MEVITFDNNRKALKFGIHKINLHQFGNELGPKARNVHPGSADICFITKIPVEQVREELIDKNVLLISDVVYRTGAQGKIKSVYFHDPDGNLLEISNYTTYYDSNVNRSK